MNHFNCRAKLPGRFYELNIHYGVFVGGMGDFNEIFLGNQKNFRGCLENLFFNGIEVEHAVEMSSYSYIEVMVNAHVNPSLLIFSCFFIEVMVRAEDESSAGGKAKVKITIKAMVKMVISFLQFCHFMKIRPDCNSHKDYVALSIHRYGARASP